MTTAVRWFDLATATLRVAFLILAIALAVISTIDWLVRTRRINPFSRTARWFRQSIDPLFAPVERQLVRAGGTPTAAPWWALAIVVIAGIIVLSLLDVIRGQFVAAMSAASGGIRGVLRQVVFWAFEIMQLALLVRVISSWVNVSPHSRWVRWTYRLTEPLLRLLRSFIPPIGMIDVTPLIAFFGLRVLESFALRVLQ